MTQWHPIFAKLLRPAVEGYYDVQTTVPVGDAPREADFVLLRRTSQAAPPFRGLWRHLTAWNILEFKGPTVSPRRSDVELLVELGLGIERRLRSARGTPERRAIAAEQVSFWYLANRLGSRFLRDAEAKLGPLEAVCNGLWRGRLLGRVILLVSTVDLPVEEDSLPLHIIGIEPLATERQVVELILERPSLQPIYAGLAATLHSTAWKEGETMARTTKKKPLFDIRPAIEMLGLKEVIKQVGAERVVEELDKTDRLKGISLDDFLAALSAADRRELKRRLQ